MAIKLLEREIQAAAFDVDGTMYEQATQRMVFGEAQRQLAIKLLGIEGVTEPDSKAIEKMRERYLTAASQSGSYRKAFKEFGGTEADYRLIMETVDRSRFLSPNPDLRDMMERLKSEVKLAVYTTTDEQTANRSCSTMLGNGWKQLFDVVQCSDTPGAVAEKPDIKALAQVAEKLGVAPEKMMMVGDLPGADMIPAAALGMMTVQVERTDYDKADLYINKITDLMNYVNFE